MPVNVSLILSVSTDDPGESPATVHAAAHAAVDALAARLSTSGDYRLRVEATTAAGEYLTGSDYDPADFADLS